MMSAPPTKAYSVYSWWWPITKVRARLIRATANVPTMLPRDRMRLDSVTARKSAPPATATQGAITDNPPKPGMMPRPPRNPRYTGQLCPQSANNAAATSTSTDAVTLRANRTTSTALPASNTKTRAAAFPPAVRRMLDMPVRPLPKFRMSSPMTRFTSM